MTEQRKAKRYQAGAKAKITGIDAGEILLSDLSITGCRIKCGNSGNIKLNARYDLEITPEDTANVEAFTLSAESKWIREGNPSGEIGFVIIESPRGKQFERYVDYLSWRYSQGQSMIGSSREPLHR